MRIATFLSLHHPLEIIVFTAGLIGFLLGIMDTETAPCSLQKQLERLVLKTENTNQFQWYVVSVTFGDLIHAAID